MITKIELSNFRRHASLSVDFTQGINLIRARNEGGKSSLTESLAYAMFGTRALRTSLDDTVTWGRDVKTLKVAATLQVGCDSYTFSRSKAGAEVVKNGKVFCTGQNEVSNFAAQMLGADVATVPKLMFANQNGLRGALEEGPKALSTLIEDLAGFSAFDQILEAASENLALGSPALLEERLKGAQATLEAASQNLPEKPDAAAVEARKSELLASIAEADAKIPALEARAVEAAEVAGAAYKSSLVRLELENALTNARSELTNATALVDKLAAEANVEIDEAQLETLRCRIKEADNHQSRLVAWRWFRALPEGTRFQGDEGQFEAAVVEATAELKQDQKALYDLTSKLEGLLRRRINHDKCDKCGQDITHLETVKTINAQVDEAVAELRPQIAACEEKVESSTWKDTKHRDTRRFALNFNNDLKAIREFVQLDESVFPPLVTWIGGEPSGTAPEAPRAALTKLEADIKALASVRAKLELAVEQRDAAAAAVSKTEQALAADQGPDVTEFNALQSKKEKAENDHLAAKADAVIAKYAIENLTATFDSASLLWASASARVADAQKVIDSCSTDLNSLSFNNDLVKKLRAIRPLVANKVWNTVLASVSVMFSQMRGEPSVITKEASGFMCNGQAVESLSGSTLDILGVALRCALLRTFIPNCGLLVLDEPAQGCDTSRTEALLGFLQGFSMTQTLLITHEETSSAIADNIIQLD